MAKSSCDIGTMVETIRMRILKGEYVPGQKLSENTLSKEFKCSRTPVRETLKRLEQDRLVSVLPHSGSYVHMRSEKDDMELTELRAYLESLAFRLASERGASAGLLSLLSDQMETQLSSPVLNLISYGRTHYLFHRQIIELSGSATLIDLYDRLNLNNSNVFYLMENEAERKLCIEEHRKIVKALSARDVKDGERLLFEHIWRKREWLKEKTAKKGERA
jgi:Transcriptional regulators